MEASKKRKLEIGVGQLDAAFNASHFDLSLFPATDLSILSESYNQVEPQTKTGEVLEFHLPPNPTHWIALSDIFLYLSLGVKATPETTGSGTTAVTKYVTSYGNFLSGTLFEAIDIRINGVSITGGSNLSAYSSMMNKILYNTTEQLKRRGPLEGFYFNTTGNEIGTDNKAYVTLLDLAKKDSMELIGKIGHALFQTPRYLPPNYSLSIRLRIAPNAFVLNRPALAEGTAFTDSLEIKKCYLDVKKVVTSSFIDHQFELALKQKKTLGIPFVDFNAVSFVVPSGSLSYASEVLLNQLPTFAAFGIVESAAYVGNYQKSPFMFKPHNLSGFRFTLDGNDLMYSNAQLSVSNNQYFRYYNQLLCTKNERGLPTCDLGTLEYTQYGYNLIPVWNSLDGKHDRVPLNFPGAVRLSLTFSQATDTNLNVIFYYEMPKRIELNGSDVYVKTEVDLIEKKCNLE